MPDKLGIMNTKQHAIARREAFPEASDSRAASLRGAAQPRLVLDPQTSTRGAFRLFLGGRPIDIPRPAPSNPKPSTRSNS